MSNHDLRLLRSNGAEQDQVLGRRKGFGLFFENLRVVPTQAILFLKSMSERG